LTEATNAREIAEAKAQGYADLQARVQKAAEEKCAKMEKTSADREILEHDASSRIKKLSRDLHGKCHLSKFYRLVSSLILLFLLPSSLYV
jgi:hypothetical protein